MPGAPIFVSIEGARQMKELSARLKKADRNDLYKKLRRNFKEAGRPTVAKIRQAAMDVKVTSEKGGTVRPVRSTGLRARAARATGLSVTKRGIRIVVSAKKFGPYGVTLPRYLDADLRRWKRWRSPIFWPGPISTAPPTRVKQQLGQPYFFVTIKQDRARFRRAAFKALEETADELTR